MDDEVKLPATISPEALTVIVDSREQNPLDVSPMKRIVGTLDTGDYTVQGLEDVIRVERKSLPDLLSCCGSDRPRFERQIERLRGFPVGVLAIEASWNTIEMGEWQSKMKPSAVVGTLMGLVASGINVMPGDSHARLGRLVSRLLYVTARRRWREARALAALVEIKETTNDPNFTQEDAA
jgi:ERCC4-type nuclease